MFASQALTGAEKNYQNLERECLVMIWGMEKFHYFLYGKQFTLETDQKPLVSIYRIQLPIVAVNLIMSNIPVCSTEIELIHEETSKDPTLTLLRHYIHMGWPIDRRMLPQELHTFWNYREDLSMENGLITKGARLLIPSTLRRKVLEQIHDGHLGIEKCMLKARDSVFWPGIFNDI